MTAAFNYDQDFSKIDFRAEPERYRVGRGEQGVLMVEPYKSELLPLWRFKTPDVAEKSAKLLYKEFLRYKKQNDFVGMEMTRKFIQMGYTRSRRYANHKGGRKYDTSGKELPREIDEEKAESAERFKTYLEKVKSDDTYIKRKKAHQEQYG